MTFRILGLSPDRFQPLFQLSDAALHQLGGRRVFASEPGAMPCRISLQHASIGEEVLLVNFEHQPANSPYRSSHAIYIRREARTQYAEVDAIPEVFPTRLLSVRAFDDDDMIVDAEVIDGRNARETFEQMLTNSATKFLHVHNARRGCYAARVERA